MQTCIYMYTCIYVCMNAYTMHAYRSVHQSTNYYWMFQGIMKIHRLPSSIESSSGGSTVAQALTPTGDETNGCPVNGIFQSLPLNETIHVLVRVYVVKVYIAKSKFQPNKQTRLDWSSFVHHVKISGSERNPFHNFAHYFCLHF